jgi:hypothetical protein
MQTINMMDTMDEYMRLRGSSMEQVDLYLEGKMEFDDMDRWAQQFVRRFKTRLQKRFKWELD